MDDKTIPTSNAEIITPARAKALLANVGPNRDVSARDVAYKAAKMAAGKWVLNGEPIIISASGQLLDGQHRLRACIKANVSFPTFVVYGIDDSVVYTLDRGRKRSDGQHLCMYFRENPHLLYTDTA